MPDARSDLAVELRRRTPAQLAALLARVPALAEALDGRGPLAPYGLYALPTAARSAAPTPTPERLAAMLVGEAGISVRLLALDRIGWQLAALASWHGGRLDRDAAIAEAGPEHADALDGAAAELDALLLSDPGAGWVALRAGVADAVTLPGVAIRPALQWVNSEALAATLRRLGATTVPSRKAERIDALEACLRDPAAVHRAAGGLSADAARVLRLLVEHGTQRINDLGIGYYNPWGRGGTPLHELTATGLAGVDSEDQVAWVWLDVTVGLAGRLFDSWAGEPAVPRRPLRDPGGLPPVLGRLAALLAHWAADPAPALADGGLGVRPVRAAAKELGVPPGEVGLLTQLAVGLGLLGTVRTGTKGRGRAVSGVYEWTTTPLAQTFAALSPERRWLQLVQAWRDEPHLNESGGLPERLDSGPGNGRTLSRSALLRLLAGEPAGTGLAADDLSAVAEARCPLLLGGVTSQLVQAAAALGLVAPDGPIGLTALARAALDGPEALSAAMPAARDDFVVQADLSVVAPPDLASDVLGRLERYVELESAAGARLYRLSERRIAGALDDGDTAAGILAFLSDHATAELAQNVTYLVRDCERRHGRLRTGACASYLRCDDPALLTRATAVKPAKLRLLAPTVAVSPLPRTKVVSSLRARGLMPVAEGPDGATLRSDTPPAAPDLRAGHKLPPLRHRIEVGDAHAEQLAQALLAAPGPSRRRGQPTAKPRLQAAMPASDVLWADDDADDEDEDVDAMRVAAERAVLRRVMRGEVVAPPARGA